MSSVVSIKFEDGTEYSQMFYTGDARDGGQKDERWKSEKLKSTHNILLLNIVVCTILLPIFQPSTKSMIFKTCILKKILYLPWRLN